MTIPETRNPPGQAGSQNAISGGGLQEQFTTDALAAICPACGADAEYPDCERCGHDFTAPPQNPFAELVQNAIALVQLRHGKKKPCANGWQRAGGGIADAEQAATLNAAGIHHLDSRTCAIDIDQYDLCDDWFKDRGIDLQALLAADDAVQIRSGRDGRAKLLYRLPDSVDWLPYVKACRVEGDHGKPIDKLELRCANSETQSQQDVLPPSVHPDTGKPYAWGGMGDWHKLPVLPDDVLQAWLRAAAEEDAAEQPMPARPWQAGNLFQRFNQTHSVGEILERHGYEQRGTRWLSPDSSTGDPGVVLLPNTDPPRVYSHHSDALANRHGHDAFSLFEQLDHGGNHDAALAAARDELRMPTAPAPAYKLLTGDEVKAMPALRWRVKHILPARGLAQIYGGSTAGKSFLAFDMAAAIADGREWFGYRVHQAPTIYIALEGQAGYRLRVDAWERHYQRRFPEAMRMIMQPLRVNSPGDVDAIAKVIVGTFPKNGVAIIDTQNAAAQTADENASTDMGAIIEGAKHLADAIEGVVVLIAHTGKDPDKGARGHSSQLPSMDATISVRRVREDREWKAEKVKDGKDGNVHGFTLTVLDLGTDDDGDPVTSCAVAPSGATADTAKPLSDSQRLAVDTYREACMAGHGIVTDGAFEGLHIDAWRAAFYAKHTGDNDDSKRRAFSRVRNDLQARGELDVSNDVYRITMPGVSIFEAKFAEAGHGTKAGHDRDMSRRQ